MRTLPKIDLHLHIDGAVRTSTMLELAAEQGHALPATNEAALEKLVRVSPDCRSLGEFLATFDVFYPLLRSPEALRRVSREVCEDLARDGVVYAELRFAPVLNLPAGTDESDPAATGPALGAAVDAVLEGMREGVAGSRGRLRANLILCCYRGVSTDLAAQTVQIAAERARIDGQAGHGDSDNGDDPGDETRPGVCGVDLAGDESRYPAADFQGVFDRARDLGLPITIHAAEGAGWESARDALDLLHARRIGHGIRIRENRALLDRVVADGVPLEICLTSNLQTATVPDLGAHPLRDYLDAGVKVTLNTDDPRISGIRLSDEWELAVNSFALSPGEQRRILENSAAASFAGPRTRAWLNERIEAYFATDGDGDV